MRHSYKVTQLHSSSSAPQQLLIDSAATQLLSNPTATQMTPLSSNCSIPEFIAPCAEPCNNIKRDFKLYSDLSTILTRFALPLIYRLVWLCWLCSRQTACVTQTCLVPVMDQLRLANRLSCMFIHQCVWGEMHLHS